jgi:hypothetical protein
MSCRTRPVVAEPQPVIKREKKDVDLIHVKDDPVDPSSEGMASVVSS